MDPRSRWLPACSEQALLPIYSKVDHGALCVPNRDLVKAINPCLGTPATTICEDDYKHLSHYVRVLLARIWITVPSSQPVYCSFELPRPPGPLSWRPACSSQDRLHARMQQDQAPRRHCGRPRRPQNLSCNCMELSGVKQ